jgi:hypothetical protein
MCVFSHAHRLCATTVGGSCAVRCANGFSPSGGQNLGYNARTPFFMATCQADGSFAGLPTCVPNCAQPKGDLACMNRDLAITFALC